MRCWRARRSPRLRPCARFCHPPQRFLLPPPLWGRVGVGGRGLVAQKCPVPRPPPPTPPQPNLAIARVRPLNKVTEVGNSRLRLGEGSRKSARITCDCPALAGESTEGAEFKPSYKLSIDALREIRIKLDRKVAKTKNTPRLHASGRVGR